MVYARLVIADQDKGLRRVFHHHASLAQLRRLHRLDRIGLGPARNPAEVPGRELPDLFGIHVPHYRYGQIARRIVFLEEGLRLGAGHRLQIAHVADDLVAVRMGLVRNSHEFFEQAPDRLALDTEPPLLHHHVFFLVKLPEHRVGKPVGFHHHPKFHLVRRKADDILRRILTRVRVETRAALAREGFLVLIMHQILLGLLLGLFELVLQLLDARLVRPVALLALRLQGQECLVYPGHRFGFGLIVPRPYGLCPLEGHVLEQMRHAGDSPDLIDRSDVGIDMERNHWHLVPFEDKEFKPVVQREFGHPLLERRQILGLDRC